MKSLAALLAVIAVVLPLSVTAADFEGIVTMSISSGDHTMPLTFAMKSGLTRVNLQAGAGRNVSMIMDPAKQQMTMIMPEQHMYFVQPMQQTLAKAEEKIGDVSLEKTDEHEKILGYTTTKYIAHSKEGTSQIWVTDELGTFAGLGSGGSSLGFGRRPNANRPVGQAWEEAFKGKQAFPMRVITTSTSGQPLSKLEVTAVDKKSLPDAEFQPPADCRKIDFGAMMQGMGLPGGMHLPRRSGGQ